jgi:hypothetical protein
MDSLEETPKPQLIVMKSYLEACKTGLPEPEPLPVKEPEPEKKVEEKKPETKSRKRTDDGFKRSTKRSYDRPRQGQRQETRK